MKNETNEEIILEGEDNDRSIRDKLLILDWLLFLLLQGLKNLV